MQNTDNSLTTHSPSRRILGSCHDTHPVLWVRRPAEANLSLPRCETVFCYQTSNVLHKLRDIQRKQTQKNQARWRIFLIVIFQTGTGKSGRKPGVHKGTRTRTHFRLSCQHRPLTAPLRLKGQSSRGHGGKKPQLHQAPPGTGPSSEGLLSKALPAIKKSPSYRKEDSAPLPPTKGSHLQFEPSSLQRALDLPSISCDWLPH